MALTLDQPPLQQAPIDDATKLISTNRWAQWFRDARVAVAQLLVWVTQSVTPTSSPTFAGLTLTPVSAGGTFLVTKVGGAITLFTVNTSNNSAAVNGGAFGAGAVNGGIVSVGRNTSGGGAAGTYRLVAKSGAVFFIWTDATGALRFGTAAPTEDGSVSDTSGSILASSTTAGITVGPTSVSSLTVQNGVITALVP